MHVENPNCQEADELVITSVAPRVELGFLRKTTPAYISDQSSPELTSRFQVQRTYHSGVACSRNSFDYYIFSPLPVPVNKFHC